MRIVAGKFRSRRLKTLVGVDTRPTLDQVKEACFGRLGDEIVNQRVLDLFAGSGSIGLEALSRGAKFCVFVEASWPAFRVMKENIANLGVESQSLCLRMDAFFALRHLKAQDQYFDLIYLDPPYQKIPLVKLLNACLPLMSLDSKIIYECLAEDEPLEPENFTRQHSARYGRIRLDTYRRTV